jgi:hypothetical protein
MNQKIYSIVIKQVYFFRAFPEKTLCLKNGVFCGRKIAKDRSNVLLCVNMIGEF